MLTPATLTVNFTANYSGLHRICWRIQGSLAPFVCTNLVECVGGGNICSAIVNIMVDPESCIPVTYEGYIQAACNPEGSATDQVAWTSTFTPNPSCKPFQINCTAVFPATCPTITGASLGVDCKGQTFPDIGPINGGGAVILCDTAAPTGLPPEYIVVPANACCNLCHSYNITVAPITPGLIDGTSLYYIDCTTKQLIRQDLTGSIPVNITGLCAVQGSVYVNTSANATATIVDVVVCT